MLVVGSGVGVVSITGCDVGSDVVVFCISGWSVEAGEIVLNILAWRVGVDVNVLPSQWSSILFSSRGHVFTALWCLLGHS